MNFLKAKDYQKYATVQELMGFKLCKLLQNSSKLYFPKVFEFGCGRGEFSKKLEKIITFNEYIKNDILDFNENSNVEIFDMNEIENHFLSKIKFDLITSNASLQWLDLKRILPTLEKMLNQNGIILLSTFGELNLIEIKQSTKLGLNYISFKDLEKLFKTYFQKVTLSQELINLEFQSPLEVFRHLKFSGVNSLGTFSLTKTFLKEFESQFANKITYHPIFIICEKSIK